MNTAIMTIPNTSATIPSESISIHFNFVNCNIKNEIYKSDLFFLNKHSSKVLKNIIDIFARLGGSFNEP
jgi:hypothetical protein